MTKDIGRVPLAPGSHASHEAPEGLRPSGVDPSRIPAGFFEAEDDLGGVVGYMCLTDFEYELGCASGGNAVYPSVGDIRDRRRCIPGCGIAEVRVIGIRVVQESADESDSDGSGEADETAKTDAVEDESAVPKECATPTPRGSK